MSFNLFSYLLVVDSSVVESSKVEVDSSARSTLLATVKTMVNNQARLETVVMSMKCGMTNY